MGKDLRPNDSNPTSCTSVPYPVGVKNAGTPAPPARIRSARVP